MIIDTPARVRVPRALVNRIAPFSFALGFSSLSELVGFLLVQWMKWAEKEPEVIQARQLDDVIFHPALWTAGVHPALARYQPKGKGAKKDSLTAFIDRIAASQAEQRAATEAARKTAREAAEGPDGPLPEPEAGSE